MESPKIKIAEWGLVFVITALAATVTLMLVRYLAPNLLGIHNDLQLVQVNKKVSPFFEGALRSEDSFVQDYTTTDPLTKMRGRPFLPNLGVMGPNDLLGFRNRSIPAQADIVTIGDSQTYGNNAPIDANWPGHLAHAISQYNPTIYNMATGGWGPIQYYYAFQKALFFHPRFIVVAFYTGNDGPDAFQMAYGSPQWSQFKTDNSLSISDMPKIIFPPETDDKLTLDIKPGISTVLSPKYRGSCIKDEPAINAGYQIMTRVIKEMATIAKEEKIRLIITLIPTKEFVYRRIAESQPIVTTNINYQQLIKEEAKRFISFEAAASGIAGVNYISVEKPLTDAAGTDLEPLYPKDENGHPLSSGYKTIAGALAKKIDAMYVDTFSGQLATVESSPPKILLVDGKAYVEVDQLNPVTKDGRPHYDTPVWSKLPDTMKRLGSSRDERFKDINLDNYREKISQAINQPSFK